MGIKNIAICCTSLVIAANAHSSIAFASQPSSGRVSIVLDAPPDGEAPLLFRIQAVPYFNASDGSLILKVRPEKSHEFTNYTIWQGGWKSLDTIKTEYQLPSPTRGDYVVSATLSPSSGGQPVEPPCFGILYVRITDRKVWSSRSAFSAIDYMQIMDAIEARGLKGVSDEELNEKAPDLAQRLHNFAGTFVQNSAPSDSNESLGRSPEAQTVDTGMTPRNVGTKPFIQPNPPPKDINSLSDSALGRSPERELTPGLPHPYEAGDPPKRLRPDRFASPAPPIPEDSEHVRRVG